MKLQWYMKNYHEVSIFKLNGNIICFVYFSRKIFSIKKEIFLIKEINLKIFKHRIADKLLNESTLCDFDWNFTINFHKKLDRVTHVICEICQKKRFDLNVQICKNIAICQNCWKNLFANDVRLYFFANFINSKVVFFHLSNLFIAKKLFIAWIHVLINYSCYKSVQYKYFDHIINFMQNISKVVRQLLSLSWKL